MKIVSINCKQFFVKTVLQIVNIVLKNLLSWIEYCLNYNWGLSEHLNAVSLKKIEDWSKANGKNCIYFWYDTRSIRFG